MILAHKSEDGTREQSVLEHLRNVAGLAGEFAGAFGAEEYGFAAGMLHDAGKYSSEFQNRILHGGRVVDHSVAGAKAVLAASSSGAARMLAYCVMGHHTGLPDGGSRRVDGEDMPTLAGRLAREVPDFDGFYEDVDVSSLLPRARPPIAGSDGFTASFFIRMLFSCLVDADFLDTETFMRGSPAPRGGFDSIGALCARLERYLRGFRPPENAVNAKRGEILRACLEKAAERPGIFRLTVPTGGGKTISSLAFALRHAAQNEQRRVIYAIPYTSIIEQNAAVFRTILGRENVLEHHGGVVYDDTDDRMDPRRLAAENWDAPVVVTTNVQFFESLFANRTSRCRRLHNIAGSVLIFDEAQMLPREFLRPCMRAVSELARNYGCTAVLCSATQPALDGLLPPELAPREIMDDVPGLYAFFRRTALERAGELADGELARRLCAQTQALCIVNSRRHAQALYALLPEEGRFHLSTLMAPSHRRHALRAIRRRLKAGKPCRVISTSLLEAGVDVDFPLVYREEAGLDSILQAAGRCNREGKRPAQESRVVVFRAEPKYAVPNSVSLPAGVTRTVADRFADLASPEAIRAYFETLYLVSSSGGLDEKGVVRAFEDGLQGFSFPFADIAGKFRLIGDETKPVLIPQGRKGRAIAQALRRGRPDRALLRTAGLHSVNLYPNDYAALRALGALEEIDGAPAVLVDLALYSEELGLALPGRDTGGEGIFA